MKEVEGPIFLHKYIATAENHAKLLCESGEAMQCITFSAPGKAWLAELMESH